MAIDRLKREAAPPTGMIGSPKPQVWDPTADSGNGDYIPVYGTHNAPRAMLYDAAGNPISQTHPLETRARHLEALLADPASETTLALVQAELELVKTELAAIKANQLNGDAKVTINGSNEDVVETSLTASASVAASGGTETTTLTPTVGKRWIIVGVNTIIMGPTGATSGTHNVVVKIGSHTSVTRCSQAYDKRMSYYSGTWTIDSALTEWSTGVLPSDKAALAQVFRGLIIDSGCTLSFTYTNSTDAEQTNNRIYRIAYIEVDKI